MQASDEIETTDFELLGRAQAGDFASFQVLVERLQPRVFGVAMRMLNNVQDAEDITQQTFLAVIEHIDSFRAESSVATWVLRIATNFALKLIRRRKTIHFTSLDGPTDGDSYSNMPHPEFIAPWSKTPIELLESKEAQAAIEDALKELDEKYRSVFILRDVEGLSVRETAESLDLTESTVKVRLLRARLMLRERLTRLFGDESQAITPDHRHE